MSLDGKSIPLDPALCVPERTTLEEAMHRLDHTAMQILFVIDDHARLIGTLTDGDIRRRLLAHGTLIDEVGTTCNRRPVTVEQSRFADGLKHMRKIGVTRAPLVDADRRIMGLVLLDRVDGHSALILAGGRGTRLGDLTRNTPKPLLQIGDKSIIRHLVESLIAAEFRNVFVAIHHLGGQIRDHFAESMPDGIKLVFLEEDEPLGTAGALSLLPPDLIEPLLVLNGDLVTRTNFAGMMHFHYENARAVTIGCAQYRHQIPFGIIEHEGGNVMRIVEKPVINRFVSAGLYVLSPMVYRMVPSSRKFDMPELVNMALENGLGVSTFPIVEYWIDVGRPEQLEQARGDFAQARHGEYGSSHGSET